MLKFLILLAVILGVIWWARGWLRARSAGEPAMSLDEARAILGVGPADGPEAIRRAHRALMAVAHPDRGGAHGEAARVNAARDVALAASGKGTRDL
ncbi:J domain-containing protein [Thermaurantiacus sp.]